MHIGCLLGLPWGLCLVLAIARVSDYASLELLARRDSDREEDP